MKKEICVALLFASLLAPVEAKDQWPGQSDFSNLNGPMPNDDPYRPVPVVDFRFNPPSLDPGAWPFVSSQAAESKLSPTHYNVCKTYQIEFPERNVSCLGPKLR